MHVVVFISLFFFFKQKTAYEMRISDWSSDVCSSDLLDRAGDTLPFQRLKNKLDEIRADPRYSFMFSGMLVSDSMAGLLAKLFRQIGRASCRERVCQYV